MTASFFRLDGLVIQFPHVYWASSTCEAVWCILGDAKAANIQSLFLCCFQSCRKNMSGNQQSSWSGLHAAIGHCCCRPFPLNCTGPQNTEEGTVTTPGELGRASGAQELTLKWIAIAMWWKEVVGMGFSNKRNSSVKAQRWHAWEIWIV